MDAALSEGLVVAEGPFLRFSLFISLLAGNLRQRPVRTGLLRQAASLVRTGATSVELPLRMCTWIDRRITNDSSHPNESVPLKTR